MKIDDLLDKIEENEKFSDTNKLFSIKKSASTDEYHIFHNCKINSEGKCQCASKSVCRKMKISEGTLHLSCITDKEARAACLILARKACGTCVSKLYGDFADS